jgi:porin-like protein
MRVNRKFGTIAALGSGTAALAMLTGLAGARADELKVNQQLLDARVDQLAAVGQQPGAGAVFSVDQNSAAGAAAVAGSFPRSVLIPGTDTSLRIYGQITEVVDYYLTGGNPNSSPQSTTVGINGQLQSIPLQGTVQRARGNGIFWQSPRESRIGFETRTPTPFGEARTEMEFDWAGSTVFSPGGANPTSVSDNLSPRVRYAYGTLGGLLAGQATSNFSDPDANAEVLDFGGNAGEPGVVRVPQIRYTIPAWWGASLSFSAETPETTVATPNGLEGSDAGAIPTLTTSCTATAPAVASAATSTCTSALLTSGVTPLNVAKSTAPDLTIAYYIPQPWGHIDFSGVVRPGLEATDGKFFAKQYVGWGGHVGLNFQPGWFGWTKDNFTFHFEGGDMIGRYVNSSTNFELATNYGAASTSAAIPGTYGGFNGPTSATSAANIIFKPTQEIGAEMGYQHWWLPNLRSNINGGFNAHYGIPIKLVNANGVTGGAASGGGQANSINKQLINAHVNLIWNPVSSVDVGIEYTWGQRTVLNNNSATMNVLISKFAFRF